jgi:hypothetical protein
MDSVLCVSMAEFRHMFRDAFSGNGIDLNWLDQTT